MFQITVSSLDCSFGKYASLTIDFEYDKNAKLLNALSNFKKKLYTQMISIGIDNDELSAIGGNIFHGDDNIIPSIKTIFDGIPECTKFDINRVSDNIIRWDIELDQSAENYDNLIAAFEKFTSYLESTIEL